MITAARMASVSETLVLEGQERNLFENNNRFGMMSLLSFPSYYQPIVFLKKNQGYLIGKRIKDI